MPRIAYYKGCVPGLSTRELDASTRALAPRLGLELIELESVTCCGAGDIQMADPDYALHLNARILAEAEHAGSDKLLTICNVCTLNLRQAAWQLRNDEQLRERVNRNLERAGARTYSGNVEVTHLLWLIAQGEALEQLAEIAVRKLDGLRVAPFYGCQLLRPSNLMGFEDPDRPRSLENVIEACGGEPVDYEAKARCCGFPILLAREKTSMSELVRPLEQALEAGAEAMVTPCPLCHLSLDAWQKSLERSEGRKLGLPIFHLSQLVALAAGIEPQELQFSRHIVPVGPVISRLQRPDSAAAPSEQ
jgi:succinate dehydrogenase / fumarate reductase cytochrome b subunit